MKCETNNLKQIEENFLNQFQISESVYTIKEQNIAQNKYTSHPLMNQPFIVSPVLEVKIFLRSSIELIEIC